MTDDLLKWLKCFIQYVVRKGSAVVSNGQEKTALLLRVLTENYTRFHVSDIQIVQDQTWQNAVELEVASAHEVIIARKNTWGERIMTIVLCL
jgi:alpha-D-ribose 1-methylphosphonate 5-triphosphate synthase subunit PhnL